MDEKVKLILIGASIGLIPSTIMLVIGKIYDASVLYKTNVNGVCALCDKAARMVITIEHYSLRIEMSRQKFFLWQQDYDKDEGNKLVSRVNELSLEYNSLKSDIIKHCSNISSSWWLNSPETLNELVYDLHDHDIEYYNGAMSNYFSIEKFNKVEKLGRYIVSRKNKYNGIGRLVTNIQYTLNPKFYTLDKLTDIKNPYKQTSSPI